MILTTNNLGLSYGANDIFEEIDLKLGDKVRAGLVGPNGVGKTSLLLILAGLLESDSGEVVRKRDLTLGYLRQEAVLTFAGQENTVYEEMLSLFLNLQELEQKLRGLEAAMAAGDMSEEVMEGYGRFQEQYEIGGGYDYQVEIKRILQGLGFGADQWDTPLTHLSGGQKTRVLLGRLLLEKPDLLILDEPTNHLDLAALEWLERTLRQWTGALIVVSHDRYFLERVVTEVWEMSQSTLKTYRGSYSSFVYQREHQQKRESDLFASEKERLEKEYAFIRKHIAGGKTDIAKGKLKRLTRDIVLLEQMAEGKSLDELKSKSWLEIGGRVRTFSPNEAARRLRDLKPPLAGPPTLKIRLKSEQRSVRSVLRSKGLQIGYPGEPLFKTDRIQLNRQDCVALLGPNGSGKSSMLRTLRGELAPLKGTLKFGDGVHVGYFAQAHEQLNVENRVIDELLAHQSMSKQDARRYLAKYLFLKDDVFKHIHSLSGGERARLALALLAAVGANFLLLDEPTNHLDIESQEVLQQVLANFDGTILLVSHDRYLVDRLATQIWEIGNGRLHTFPGNYSDYLKKRDGSDQELAPPEPIEPEALAWVEEIVAPPVNKREQREREHRHYALQGAIDDTEAWLTQLENQLKKAHDAENEPRIVSLEVEIGETQTKLDALLAKA